jgi:hypothetical protein
MVFVVERYLPGLAHSDLLHELARLERTQELRDVAGAVRYLGSTIVLGDEACFCHFDRPTEAAVAEANRRAGVPFDRIVAAVTVQPEGRTTMNVSTTIPQTVQIRRGRLLGLLAGVATLAAAITWLVLALAGGTGGDVQASAPAQSLNLPIPAMSVTAPDQSWNLPIPATAVTRARAAQNGRVVTSIMDLTPGDLAGGGLGGYALPNRQSDQTTSDVLASMSPRTRQYTEAVMKLTFAQLAAGAAGSP